MIRASDLRKQDNERKNIKKETYKIILNGFMKKIKHSAENGDKFVFLKVPPVVFGYPMYDIREASTFLGRQLKLLGYVVNLVADNELCVTWGVVKKIKPPPRIHKQQTNDDSVDFTSLMNLKKAAEKYK